jgi:predicted nucleotidyltransferase
MTLAKDFEDFIKLLNDHDVQYMVVGGYALGFHGKPRYTGDLDIWIGISEDNAGKLIRVINDFGMASLGFTKEDFLRPGFVTQIGYPPLRIDILNAIDGIGFEEAYQNKQTITEDDLVIAYIGLNDLLANKIASGRKRDIDDIKAIKKIVPKNETATRKKKGPRLS